MSFVVYDLVFMAIFVIAVVIFLSTRKKGLERQGILYLYKTKFGIKFIDGFAKKHQKILKPLQYVVIFCGYVLMVSMVYLMFKTTETYLTTSISQVIKAPPLAPLIPYFPQIFGLESLFPPLYFTYFIIALGVVAIGHEAAHGIYSRFYKFRVKSTGFVFLGPILGAFVEPDEKQMSKAKTIPQLTVLAAGTFANVLMFVFFGLLMLIFFYAAFTPAGVQFNTYALSEVNVSGMQVIGPSALGTNLTAINVSGQQYFISNANLKIVNEKNLSTVIVIDDSPAFESQIGIGEAIMEIDGVKIRKYDDLKNVLGAESPGKKIKIKTAVFQSIGGKISEIKEYELTLGNRNGKAFLGVGFMPMNAQGTFGFIYGNTLGKIKDPLTFYDSRLGDFGWFIYYLLWWVVVINILVALFNMLPLGILDGGKFFLLTISGITKSEKVGNGAYKAITIILILLFAALMLKWAIGFI
jgi:membrane-associated protease RseP (regulator of RpoE activity)